MPITSAFPKGMPIARSTDLRLQIAHVGKLCRGSKPFSAKDQKDWQAAWFGQHMPNRCHPRKAAACELGLWLSTPAHSKPGGTLGWQCLWLSTLFITLLNLPSVAAQLNPPAFVKNLRCLDWEELYRTDRQAGPYLPALVRSPCHLQYCCLATKTNF